MDIEETNTTTIADHTLGRAINLIRIISMKRRAETVHVYICSILGAYFQESHTDGAEGQDGIGAMCTRLTDANVQYKKLPDGTNLVSDPVNLLQDMCIDTQKCIAALPQHKSNR